MRDPRLFADRTEAGRALAAAVAAHLGQAGRRGRPLVLALPRGGVPVGFEVARMIDADLDVIVARKIGAPWQPELGIGAVAEDGPPIFNRAMLRELRLDAGQLEPLVQRERAEVRRRLGRYRGDRPPPDLSNRTVIVVDDGLATGATARAALAAAREKQPARLMFAAPVCAADSAAALRAETDAVICVRAPAGFQAVGRWYADFGQLSDAEVERLLTMAWGAGMAGRFGSCA